MAKKYYWSKDGYIDFNLFYKDIALLASQRN